MKPRKRSKPTRARKPALKKDLVTLLLDINRRWLSSLDPAVLLPEIVSYTRSFFGVSDVTLLMLDHEGYVSETNATNVFMVKNGIVLTPHGDSCLPGICFQLLSFCFSVNGFFGNHFIHEGSDKSAHD